MSSGRTYDFKPPRPPLTVFPEYKRNLGRNTLPRPADLSAGHTALIAAVQQAAENAAPHDGFTEADATTLGELRQAGSLGALATNANAEAGVSGQPQESAQQPLIIPEEGQQ